MVRHWQTVYLPGPLAFIEDKTHHMKHLFLLGLLIFIVGCDKNKDLVNEGTGTVSFGSNYELLNCTVESEVFVDGELIGSLPGNCDSIIDCAGDATLNHELSEREHSFEIILSAQDGSCYADTSGEFTIYKDDCLAIHFNIEGKIEDVPEIIPRNNYLIIGDTTNNIKYIRFSEQDRKAFKMEEHMCIHLIDQDSLFFDGYWSWYFGGSLGQTYLKANGTPNVQIAVDTSQEGTVNYLPNETIISYRDVFTPKPFELSDTITNDLSWSNGEYCYFQKYQVELDSDTTYFTKGIGSPWKYYEPHYLAFRIITSDTLLGWLKLERTDDIEMSIIYKNGINAYELVIY